MSLQKKIENDMHNSLKNGESFRLGVLRMLKSDLMYEKAKTGNEIAEEKVLEVVAKAAKRRKESIIEFEKANRTDLAEKEKSELVIIEEYLPRQMDEKEAADFIDAFISSNGVPDQSSKGRFMGQIMKELKGKADGSLVREILEKKLSN